MSPMVPLQPAEVLARRTRLHITGITGTGKTTSALTAPHSVEHPLLIASVPGEKGYDSIPLGDPSIIPLVWQEEFKLKQDSRAILKEFETSLFTHITKGPYQTVVIDGFHHYVDLVIDDVSGGAWFRGEDFSPSLYGVSYGQVNGFVNRLCQTTIPVVIFVSWATSKGDRSARPGEKAQDIPQHTYPDLPGKYGREILGQFSLTVHQSWRKEGTNPLAPKIPMWQLKPDGDVWGCAVKAPVKVTQKLPTFVKADFAELMRVLQEAEK